MADKTEILAELAILKSIEGKFVKVHCGASSFGAELWSAESRDGINFLCGTEGMRDNHIWLPIADITAIEAMSFGNRG